MATLSDNTLKQSYSFFNNTKQKRPLSIEEQLNVECYMAATQLKKQLCFYQVPKSQPQIAIATPHIVISNSTITRHIIHQLQQLATILTYHQYLAEKYTWPRHSPGIIVWPVLTIALNWLTQNKKQIIQKFIHGWLLLQIQPQVTSTSVNKLCPSCCQQHNDK